MGKRAKRCLGHPWFLAAMLASVAAPAGSQDLLIADFENESFGEWAAAGEAFGAGPESAGWR